VFRAHCATQERNLLKATHQKLTEEIRLNDPENEKRKQDYSTWDLFRKETTKTTHIFD
jgi:hypothetical protein